MLRIRSIPGTGGSEDEYQYLAEGVQSDGWLAIVMGYKASGAAALRSDMREPGGIKKDCANWWMIRKPMKRA